MGSFHLERDLLGVCVPMSADALSLLALLIAAFVVFDVRPCHSYGLFVVGPRQVCVVRHYGGSVPCVPD